MTVHWCGTGLSSGPGLRHLIEQGHPLVIWNRSLENAEALVGDVAKDLRRFDMDALKAALSPDDVIVSMLPGDFHVPLAQLAMEAGAHFVSSSYISPEMAALDDAARQSGTILVNEVGLDPGIDHLMAHALVAAYRASSAFDPANHLSFLSYCGGIPKHPNPFRYKFSWSPLGVLKALRSPSRSIRAYSELRVERPWDAIGTYTAPLPTPEDFEVYPNRDSLPFIAQYDIDPSWTIKDFVRGTLRLNGWADAWKHVFAEVETLDGPEGDARLAEMSAQFWAEHAYDPDEPDRVVLCVDLKAERDGVSVWHQTYVMDAWGDARGTAMARLVSQPVALAVNAVLNRAIPAGVHAAPSDPELVEAWLADVDRQAQYMALIDRL